MAKTNQEFISGLTEKLEAKMKTIRKPDNDRDVTMTAVCEAETILTILKEFLELEKEREKEDKTKWNQYRDSEDSDESDGYDTAPKIGKKDSTY